LDWMAASIEATEKCNSIFGFAAVMIMWLSQFWAYPSSYLLFKTQRVGDWILSRWSSGGSYSDGPNRKSYSLVSRPGLFRRQRPTFLS
jgi:hypothetical protein